MTLDTFLRDPRACLEMTVRLIGISVAVSGLEWWVARQSFGDATPLGWPLLQQRFRFRRFTRLTHILGVVLAASGFARLQLVRILAGLVLLGAAGDPVARPIALGLATGTALLTHWRQFGVGVLGGDRMRLCVLGALSIGELAPESRRVQLATLAFIAGQSVLAYTTSGLLKFRKTMEWRDGTAIGLLLRHELLGDAALSDWLLRNPGINRLATWCILALEVLFPLALLGGPPVAAVFVGAVFLMHLAIGHWIGLAPFFWAFLATYPAVLFCSQWVWEAMGGR
jgi:hypothetical protein